VLGEKQMIRPDVAYFTREQIIASSIGEHPIPTFVIEIVSQHDESPYIEKKIQDYFTAGVSLVWLIFPEMKMVKICRSIKESQNYFENEQINASPVIPDFTMMVGDLFKV
jgi:Uma2 family endonuclease